MVRACDCAFSVDFDARRVRDYSGAIGFVFPQKQRTLVSSNQRERLRDDKQGAPPRDFREAKEHHQNEEAFYDNLFFFFFVFFFVVRASARREIIVVDEREDNEEENEEGAVEHIYAKRERPQIKRKSEEARIV